MLVRVLKDILIVQELFHIFNDMMGKVRVQFMDLQDVGQDLDVLNAR